jgi:hypothetical protein
MGIAIGEKCRLFLPIKQWWILASLYTNGNIDACVLFLSALMWLPINLARRMRTTAAVAVVRVLLSEGG